MNLNFFFGNSKIVNLLFSIRRHGYDKSSLEFDMKSRRAYNLSLTTQQTYFYPSYSKITNIGDKYIPKNKSSRTNIKGPKNL